MGRLLMYAFFAWFARFRAVIAESTFRNPAEAEKLRREADHWKEEHALLDAGVRCGDPL